MILRKSVLGVLIIIMLFGLYYVGFDLLGPTTGTIISIFSTLSVISIGFIIFIDNRQPAVTMAWILLLALLPVVGVFFYFWFGQNVFKRHKYEKKAKRDRQVYQMIENAGMQTALDLSSLREDHQRLLQLSQRLAVTPVSQATETTILTNGGQTFTALLEALETAEHHIHMEYYIYRADDIGTRIQQILIEKAQAGIEVRFMVDAVGSMQLPRLFLQEMREAGVQVGIFGEARILLLSSQVNYRNHRKIVVIDGNIGFIGGLNVGDEYLSRSQTYGFWRDTHMQIRGEGVRTLQIIFLQDWLHVTGETCLDQVYFSPRLIASQHGAVQMIASGPDNDLRVLKHVFFSMITSAKRSVWLATPYFIPDESILTALRMAALSGLDVRILFPGKPDKRLPFYASHSYFVTLLEAGVRIYEYEKGFLHSKLLIVDGEIATIGTANMDMRSFHLNFEVNALLVETESVHQMVRDFERDLNSASLIIQDRFARRKVVQRLVESAARLISPML